MKHLALRLFILLLAAQQHTLWAQASSETITLNGYIRNASNGESMIGAAVILPEQKSGTYTNEYGYYSITISKPSTDSIEIIFRFLGFDPLTKRIPAEADLSLDIELGEKPTTLETVEIVANSYQEQLTSSEMSVTTITMDEAKRIPAFLGEVDIIKSLQLKPGVSSGSEGSSGIFVRGGGPDQNLVLLDGTTVYNPSHLFGFFSTFNSDAVKDVKLFKGGFPAKYGGRLSSVIDVKMNEGNRKKFSGSGGLGLISSRLTLEGPIGGNEKASFMLSGRRTYVDIFTRLINQANEDNADFNPIPDYFFYDLNGKTNVILGEKDQIFISGYLGRDQFTFDDNSFDFKFAWGNSNAAVRWNHLFSPRLFLNTTVSFSDYFYEITNRVDVFAFELGSQIRDYSIRTDFTFLPNDKHTVRFGATGISHRFIVGRLDAGSDDDAVSFSSGETYFATEAAAYISDDIQANSRTKIHLGLRLSGFEQEGKVYSGLEPRASISYRLNPSLSWKASYARMYQYLHLVTNTGATLPTDVWYPSTPGVRPQISDQVATGFTWLIGDQFLVTQEVYYKWLQNQVDFKDGANLFVNNDLESEFVFGTGTTYGYELYVEKNQGRFTGWLGYTLAWAFREFPTLIDPNFPPRNDRRHDISIVGMYDINKKLSASISWEYRSGDAISFPEGLFLTLGPSGNEVTPVPIYSSRNSFRMPAYHRMDVGLIWKFDPKWGESDLTFSVYNAYNRRNPYFIFFETETNENDVPTNFVAQQVALFPIIPSITYNFKF